MLTGGFQICVDSYTVNDDTATMYFTPTLPATAYYYRFFTTDPAYTFTKNRYAISQPLDDGGHYFVVTGKEGGTGLFPAGGPARQWFYINTFGFGP